MTTGARVRCTAGALLGFSIAQEGEVWMEEVVFRTLPRLQATTPPAVPSWCYGSKESCSSNGYIALFSFKSIFLFFIYLPYRTRILDD